MKGFVGCSNTVLAVQGYIRLGGQQLWPDVTKYGFGEVHQWAAQKDGNKLWMALDGAIVRHGPPERLWWQICVHTDYANQAMDDALAVLPRLLQRCPDLAVSPINGYTPANLSPSVAWQVAGQVAFELAAQGAVETGAAMPDLSADLLKNDKVHPNPKGANVVGKSLLDWLGS